jgi:hypothetical protein
VTVDVKTRILDWSEMLYEFVIYHDGGESRLQIRAETEPEATARLIEDWTEGAGTPPTSVVCVARWAQPV